MANLTANFLHEFPRPVLKSTQFCVRESSGEREEAIRTIEEEEEAISNEPVVPQVCVV
jgi:hypothetical protein